MSDETRRRAVESLLTAAAGDWSFADLYLERAEVLLHRLLPRERWRELRRRQQSRSELAEELRRAALRGEWEIVRQVAASDLVIPRDVVPDELMALGNDVYGPRRLRPTPLALAIAAGASVTVSGESPLCALDRLCQALEELVGLDPAWREHYSERARVLRALDLGAEPGDAPSLGAAELRRQILDAIDHADLASVQRLAETALAESGREPVAEMRLEAPPPTPARAEVSAEPLPDAAIERGLELGLAPFSLPEDSAARQWLWAGQAAGSAGKAALWANLELLRTRPFITSGGHRYLPGFESEWLLVETHPEGSFRGGDSLLERLALPRRRGLSRTAIEDALLRHGPAVLRALGLDARRFRLTCIPFDAYLRLAPKLGWGRARQWTHFDGYQIARDGHLLALAGGDVRYGGPEDLCSVSLRYDSDALDLRLAVVRRSRLSSLASGRWPDVAPSGAASRA